MHASAPEPRGRHAHGMRPRAIGQIHRVMSHFRTPCRRNTAATTTGISGLSRTLLDHTSCGGNVTYWIVHCECRRSRAPHEALPGGSDGLSCELRAESE